MSINPLNHIDLRVVDSNVALPFYQKLLPAFGFTYGGSHKEPNGALWEGFAVEREEGRPGQFFAITEDKDHRPNRNCIAFLVESREKVDQIADIVREAEGRNIEGPCECPEYGETYYAVFFEDPSGNRLEVHSRA